MWSYHQLPSDARLPALPPTPMLRGQEDVSSCKASQLGGSQIRGYMNANSPATAQALHFAPETKGLLRRRVGNMCFSSSRNRNKKQNPKT